MTSTPNTSGWKNTPQDYGLGKLPNKTAPLPYQIRPQWLYAENSLSHRIFEDEETALEVYNTLVFPQLNASFQNHLASLLLSEIKHAEQCMYKMNDLSPESLSYMRDTVDFIVNRWKVKISEYVGEEIASRLSIFVNPITETEGFLDNPYIGTLTMQKLYSGAIEMDFIHDRPENQEYFNKVALALSMKCLTEKTSLLELSKQQSNS